MDLSTMADWLTYIGLIHSKEMDLGLERIKPVARKMGVDAFECPVVIVGGTNGKGSTVACMEAVYRAAGYNVGAFTSPILFKHNEQVRVNAENPSDEIFCEAFAKVEAARGEITITPFEFQTLAALCIFKTQKLDVLILEVGLGGRLDATNIIDADVAVVTSIGIDHIDFLGDTREKIGFEKAGIFRKDKLAVCGDLNPPASLIEYAEQLGTKLYFSNNRHASERWHLIPSQLAPQNIATAMMAVELLQDRLPVTQEQINHGITTVTLPGRLQVIAGDVTEIHDVAHNVDSVQWLSNKLSAMPCVGKTYAVFSMLGDKDIRGCLEIIKHQIDGWYVAPLNVKRGASLETLRNVFGGVAHVSFLPTIADAYQEALKVAVAGDRIVVFGSFYTLNQCRVGKAREASVPTK